MDTCKLHIIFLYLQCVFHSIRFKVNNMGSRRWPIFFAIIFTFKTYSDLILFLLFKLSLVYFFLLNLQ